MPSDKSINLENALVAALTREGIPTEEEVRTLAESLRHIPNFSVDDGEFADMLQIGRAHV